MFRVGAKPAKHWTDTESRVPASNPDRLGASSLWRSKRASFGQRRVPFVKVREVLRRLVDDGWYLVATRGSHRQFKHRSKPGRVTVSGNLGREMAPGILASVFRQAQIFRKLP
jgi:predicted RNA binding protein YcfA (HicA-like mRNA interferase family)